MEFGLLFPVLRVECHLSNPSLQGVGTNTQIPLRSLAVSISVSFWRLEKYGEVSRSNDGLIEQDGSFGQMPVTLDIS